MIISFYAALLALMLFILSVRVIRQRNSMRTGLGDGGDFFLQRDIRIHSNFIEYVPLCLMLLFLAEMQGLAEWSVHALGLLLVIGRIAHAYALYSQPDSKTFPKWTMRFRIVGMSLTFMALLVPALFLLVQAAFWL